MFNLNEKGFTLIEALIAVAIMAIALIGLITTQAQFSRDTADRTAMNCIVDAAVSAVAECQSSIAPTNKTCAERGNAAITISLGAGQSCSPAAGACNDVTITAAGLSRSFAMTTKVCN